ncbi:uncharacterized protein LOC119769944 isoform X1 [Culex quinquefasciatus]|uniref:uncharacterized protein LOC119769944 isoform X1 n=1 Tax=Culex quinquefasciatus TaxID=7176 RepID=UPI0018E34321|nr:uncharacterized protein LOC119769944 isoform X1 [Culex quinquefasciatus]
MYDLFMYIISSTFSYMCHSAQGERGFASRSRITEPCSPIEGMGVWMASLMDLYASSTPQSKPLTRRNIPWSSFTAAAAGESFQPEMSFTEKQTSFLCPQPGAVAATASEEGLNINERRQDPRANEIDKIPFVAWQQMESARIREGASWMKGGKLSKTLHQKQQQNSGGKLGKLDASFFLDGNDDDCNEEEK